MEPKMSKVQEECMEKVRNSVTSQLATQRVKLKSLIDEQLTLMHQTLLDQMEADLRQSLPTVCDIDEATSNLEKPAPKEEERAPIAPGDDAVALNKPDVDAVALNKPEQTFERNRQQNPLTRLVGHPAFEGFFMGAIIVNTLVTAFQAQYRSFDVGARIDYPKVSDGPSTWASAGDAFSFLEYMFAVLYTIEIVFKIVVLRSEFWKSGFNVFDLFLVSFWYLKEATRLAKFLNPTILRLCRLARLARVIQHFEKYENLDTLYMLITAISASFSVLIWSVLLLFGFLAIVSLITNALLMPYLEDLEEDPAGQRAVYQFFGSFSRSFFSMFDMSFHSHAPIMRVIMEKVDEGWAVYFLAYKCLVGLSVMKVITGVFLHETFKVCSEDDMLMIIQKKRAVKTNTRKMSNLFASLNDDGGTTLTWNEFQDVLTNDWVRMWLGAMGLDTSNAARLWYLLDASGDGELTAEELVKGVSRLKGSATSCDMNYVVNAITALTEQVGKNETILTRFSQQFLLEEQRRRPSGADLQGNHPPAQPELMSDTSHPASQHIPSHSRSRKPQQLKPDESVSAMV